MRAVVALLPFQSLLLIGGDRPEVAQQTTLREYFAALERSCRHRLERIPRRFAHQRVSRNNEALHRLSTHRN